MPETIVPHKPGVRRFTPIEGFVDTTQFIDLHPTGEVYRVYKDRQVVSIPLDEKAVLSYVNAGQWKEIPPPVEKKELSYKDFYAKIREENARHRDVIAEISKRFVKFQDTCKHPRTKRISKYNKFCAVCNIPLRNN